MLDFMYSHDYSDIPTADTDESTDDPLVINARVYALAEKYQIKGLKDVAKGKFITELEMDWTDKDFFTAIKIVYTTTPSFDRGLRDAVNAVVYNNRNYLQYRLSFMELVREHGDFAVDVTTASWDPESISQPHLGKGAFGKKDMKYSELFEQS